ncbi:uncharacterized protein LOC131030295 [Cryptomeria japonica]|uniref:uncharacterized protein LOC131030295 n=1 Tax=Cryptomeria japonica TaxID=3369 RepID=UPI0027DA4E76|nr:uncharacterized protein LOC131030295 [Cryptomeria japonica]
MMGTAVERGNELEEKVGDLMFPKLNNVYTDLPYLEGEDELTMDLLRQDREDVLARLDFLLRNSPLLKNLTLNLSYCFESFKNQLLGLKRGSVEINILNENKDEREHAMVGEGLDRCGHFLYENEVEDSEDENEVEGSEDESEIYDVDDYECYENSNDYEVFEDYDYPSG